MSLLFSDDRYDDEEVFQDDDWETEEPESHRLGISTLLIVIALVIASARMAVVTSREGDTAFLSANDRSRWCTVAALVEDGTYQIDRQVAITGEKKNRRPWYTIDMVRHEGDDGKQHYYSSKPPLFPTMIAGVYWCLYQVTGMTLTDQPIYLARILLFLINLPLLALFYCCTVAAIRLVVRDPWTVMMATAATCFGTMMLPFAIALNNHLPAAAMTALTMYLFVRSRRYHTPSWLWIVAGMAAGFTAANELPALSMVALWGGILLLTRRSALVGYTAGVAVVAIAFFVTNYAAHGCLRPPYMHRGDGSVLALVSAAENELPAALDVIDELAKAKREFADSEVTIEPTDDQDRWRAVVNGHRFYALKQSSPTEFEIRDWDDWYDYPTSYWIGDRRRGVDKGEPSRLTYFANMMIGHYGIFSLTPIWVISLIGIASVLADRENRFWLIVAAMAVASVVCGAFYVMRPEIDRNYGGVSVCFRWMLWFAPMWLLAAAWGLRKMTDWAATRWLAIGLLAWSVFSMATALSSPWQSPWIYRFWSFLGWIEP
ncbi:hypothetical protein [Stieleria varia]|uniref:Glycosyltransferase RgtA/B/C/D-like domain-containing protein n=1 Tax=Stieleria varia TaxID=2528005 RepID=A0A5C6ASG9_9BACT|nr:hypothetical protein [Stieleria varia]TWU02478.1 hypothetical protein Pla52n_35280 [Stieleria varia]